MNFFDKLREAPEISVTMMGPRSVGKTTVMTSLFFDTRTQICSTNLYMNSEEQTELQTYYAALVKAVKEGNAANLPATSRVSEFHFDIGLRTRQPTVRLTVRDFPGEFLTGNPGQVNDFVSKSSVVLVAIDTPFLMEAEGRYNEEKNQVGAVTSYLTSNASEVRDKMVLFVPLKCERYAHDGRIEEVTQRVEATYAELIKQLANHNIASFITPIQTLGGIELDRFDTSKQSPKAVYRICKESPDFAPSYCVQPLYYLLAYVANYYQWQQTKGANSWWDRVKNSLGSYLKKDRDFYTEILKMQQYIIVGRDGFKKTTSNQIIKF